MIKLYNAFKRLQAMVEVYHWMYSKYDLHNVLGEFEENFYPLMDDLIESDVNINGNFSIESVNILVNRSTDINHIAVAKKDCLHELNAFHITLAEYVLSITYGKEVLIPIAEDIYRLLNKTSYKIKMT